MSYAATVLADSPTVYYRLGDTAAPAVPSPGLGVNAAAVGAGPSFGLPGATADGDGAVLFAGNGTDYLQTASSPGTAYNLGDGPFSIEFWYLWGGYASGQTIANSLGKGTGAYVVRLNSTGKWVVRKSGTGDCFVTTASFNDQASWHHVVVTRLLATQPHIYVDGVDQAGTHTAQTFADSTTGFSPGVDAAAVATGAWVGRLDEVALYKSALSQGQVLAHFAAAGPLPFAGQHLGGVTWRRRFRRRQAYGPPAAGPVTQVALADAGSAADTLAVAAAVPLADAGSADDSGLAVTAAVPLADAGTAADTLAAGVAVALADAGAGADTLAVAAAAALAESGSSASTLAVTAAVPLADSGTGTDTLAVAAAVPLAESGTGADTLAIQAATNIALAESGSAATALALTAVTTANAEAGTGTDTLAVLVTLALAEAGAGADSLAVTVPAVFTPGVLTAGDTPASALTAGTSARSVLTAGDAATGVLTAGDMRTGGPG